MRWFNSVSDKHKKEIVVFRFLDIFIIIGFGPYSLQIYCIDENENHQGSAKSRNFLLFNNSSIAINSECCYVSGGERRTLEKLFLYRIEKKNLNPLTFPVINIYVQFGK